MAAPSNMPLLNPEVMAATQSTYGDNLRAGAKHFVVRICARSALAPPRTLPMQPGRDVAITPGAVVFRNELIELMQYQPAPRKRCIPSRS